MAAENNQPVGANSETAPKWPGWPGDNVFRLIVPVLKVGSIIGRKGELIKKMCDETRARIRVLEAPVGTPDRVDSINGQKAAAAVSLYGKSDLGLGGASYSQLPESTYSSLASLSDYSSQGLEGGYTPGLGGYSSYRY